MPEMVSQSARPVNQPPSLSYVNDDGETVPSAEATQRIFWTPIRKDGDGDRIFIKFWRSNANPSDWVGVKMLSGSEEIDIEDSSMVIQEGGNIDDFEKALYSVVEEEPMLLSELKWKMESKGFRWIGKPKAEIMQMSTVTVIRDCHPQPVDFIVARDKQNNKEYLLRSAEFLMDEVDKDLDGSKVCAKVNASIISLFEFAFVPESRYGELAEMALPEKWTLSQGRPYEVLINYLKYTFEQACRITGALIQCPGEYAIFNTGLVDRNYDWIYAYFVPNFIVGKQKWFLYGFCVIGNRGNSGLGKKVALKVGELPHRVTWLDHSKLYFDTTLKVYSDWTHIIQQRIDRFPPEFVLRYFSHPEIVELYKKIEQNRKTREYLFKEIETCVQKLDNTEANKFAGYKGRSLSVWDIDRLGGKQYGEYLELQKLLKSYKESMAYEVKSLSCLQEFVNRSEFADAQYEMVARLEKAIELAQKKIIWDYSTAIPIYYPTQKSFGFLLPLSLLGTKGVDVALVVSKAGGKAYQGQTVLTKEMAYSNARLLRRPDTQWMFEWIRS